MIRFRMRLLLIFGYLLIIDSSEASDSLNIFLAGENAIKQGYFDIAALEFERVAYLFADNNRIRTLALLKKAECRKYKNMFSESLQTLSRISFFNLDDSVIVQVRYSQALMHYLTGNYLLAENRLVQLKYQIKDTALLVQTDFLKILIYNEQERWQEAKVIFTSYLHRKNISLDSLKYYQFLGNKRFFKNEKFAKNISYFLPGSGQIYAKKVLQAIVSICLQSASIWYTIDSFKQKYLVSSLFTGAGLFYSFNTGGAKNAKFLVRKYNIEKKIQVNENLKKVLLNIVNSSS